MVAKITVSISFYCNANFSVTLFIVKNSISPFAILLIVTQISVSPCASLTCQNDGTCYVDGTGTAKCSCLAAFEGQPDCSNPQAG